MRFSLAAYLLVCIIAASCVDTAMSKKKKSSQSGALLKSCNQMTNYDDLIKVGKDHKANRNDALAKECFEIASRLKPERPDAWFEMGIHAADQGDTQTAVQLLTKCTEIAPNLAEGYSQLGHAYYGSKMFREAIPNIQYALSRRPARHDHNNLGLAYYALKMHDEAIAAYTQALSDPGDDNSRASVLLNMGNAYQDAKQYEQAERTYAPILKLAPNYAIGYYSLARVQTERGNTDSALNNHQMAIKLNPSFVEAYVNIAWIYKRLGKHGSAVEAYKAVVALKPDAAQFNQLADFLGDNAQYGDAIATYEQALKVQPFFPAAFYSRLHYLIHTCAWRKLEKATRPMRKLVLRELAEGSETEITPIEALVMMEPYILKKVAVNFSQRSLNRLVSPGAYGPQYWAKTLSKKKRLRIGYISGGFRVHPDGKNMQGVFSRHDRKRVELFCYSVKREDSDLQRSIAKDCDSFVELQDLDHQQAAARINQDKVHVLLDVNGFTGEGVREQRNVILAYHPARIQVNFLAWVATSGSPYVDYIVTDPVASPPEFRDFYSERLLYMPPSYFVSSLALTDSQSIDPRDNVKALGAARVEVKLPREGTLFSAFNQLWKIDRKIFGVWMEILKRVPGSHLWLPIFPDVAVPSLQEAADISGVGRDRLVFTQLFPAHEHLRIKALADIQLDAYLYNGHTSGADVLWGGTPTVTLPKDKQSARVGASLLAGLGMAHTTARTLKDYEDIAVAMGSSRSHIDRARRQVWKQRSQPQTLFDVSAWVKAMESAMTRAWELDKLASDDNARWPRMHVLPFPRDQ